MGWANIADGGPDGFYSIDVDFGGDIVQKRIDVLRALINTLQTTTIPANQAAVTAAGAEVTLWKDVLNIRIGQLNAAIAAGDKAEEESIRKGIDGTTIPALAERLEKQRQASETLIRSKFELAATQAELKQKQAIETYRQQDAWCVDLTEDASGIVATCEVPGEPTYVLVAPGARAPKTGDGALLARGAMTGPQAYWNSAVLPGWQKWKPDYRAGIISDINYSTDRARVTLLPIKSSAQGLNINRVDVLNAVPIEYMTCNAAAFANGDQVVVQFDARSWSGPKVIGFLHHPKPCDLDGIACIPASDSAPFGWGEGPPSHPQYVAPLGVPGADKSYVVINGTPPNALQVKRFILPQTGMGNTIGRVVYTMPDGKTTLVAFASFVAGRSSIYRDGVKIGQTPAGTYLSDMALFTQGGIKYLWCICFDEARANVMSYRARYTANFIFDWLLLGQRNAEAEFGTNETWLGVQRAFHRASINASATQCVVFVMHGTGGYEGFWATGTTQSSGAPLPAPTGGYVVFTARDLSVWAETWNAALPADIHDFSCSTAAPNVDVNAAYQYTRTFDAYFDGDLLRICTYSIVASWFYQITLTEHGADKLVEFTEHIDHTITIDFGFLPPIIVTYRNWHDNTHDHLSAGDDIYSAAIDRDMRSITIWYYDWKDKVAAYSIQRIYANGTVTGTGRDGDADSFSGNWEDRSDLYVETPANNGLNRIAIATAPIFSSGTFINSGGDEGTTWYTLPNEPPPNGWRGGVYSIRRGLRWSAFRHSGPRWIGGNVFAVNVVNDPMATIMREITPGNPIGYMNFREQIANLSSWKNRTFLSLRKRTHGNLLATEASPGGPSVAVNQWTNIFDGVNVVALTQVVGINPRFNSICRW